MSEALVERCAGCGPTWPQVTLEIATGLAGLAMMATLLVVMAWVIKYVGEDEE